MLDTSSHLDVDVAGKVLDMLKIAYSCFSADYFLLLLQVIKGIIDGCKQSDCSLLGGDRGIEIFFIIELNFLCQYFLHS
jgi:hypothetical protein